mmetsp:Transcript_6116/g.15126  ORF Transcript_6116/g.15126 Transcript_6116/m.15126 type:complete len:220 (-) Transcript_6116:1104-1763(-)
MARSSGCRLLLAGIYAAAGCRGPPAWGRRSLLLKSRVHTARTSARHVVARAVHRARLLRTQSLSLAGFAGRAASVRRPLQPRHVGHTGFLQVRHPAERVAAVALSRVVAETDHTLCLMFQRADFGAHKHRVVRGSRAVLRGRLRRRGGRFRLVAGREKALLLLVELLQHGGLLALALLLLLLGLGHLGLLGALLIHLDCRRSCWWNRNRRNRRRSAHSR